MNSSIQTRNLIFIFYFSNETTKCKMCDKGARMENKRRGNRRATVWEVEREWVCVLLFEINICVQAVNKWKTRLKSDKISSHTQTVDADWIGTNVGGSEGNHYLLLLVLKTSCLSHKCKYFMQNRNHSHIPVSLGGAVAASVSAVASRYLSISPALFSLLLLEVGCTQKSFPIQIYSTGHYNLKLWW